MNERQQLRFPSILLQVLDSYFDSENKQAGLEYTLNYLSVTPQQLRDPNYFFDGDQFFLLVDLLRKTSVHEPPAIQVLRHLSISNMGMAGIAGLTALTLNEAFGVAMKFFNFVMPAGQLRRIEDNGVIQLEASLITDLKPCNRILIEIILGALKQFSDEVTGEKLGLRLEFSHSPAWGTNEEKTIELYQNYFDCEVTFNSTTSSIFFRTVELDKRSKNPNTILHSLAKNAADKELTQRGKSPTLTDSARELLITSIDNGAPLSLEDLAASLHLTSRTLSRKLTKEKTQYKTLLNEVRFERAKTLLKNTDTPIKQLASRLGFSNADAFSRAFKIHTGITPVQWKSKD